MYLTDEVFLYRVVGWVADGRDGVVELEDCYLLDVVRVSISDVRERRLRVVTPAPIDGRTRGRRFLSSAIAPSGTAPSPERSAARHALTAVKGGRWRV